MGSGKPRTRLSTEHRRRQLLGVAQRLFANRPFDEVGIDDVASAAEVSPGLIYHYFGGKRELYLAVVELGAQELLAATCTTSQLPALDNLRRALGGFLAYAEEHRDAYLAVMRGAVAPGDDQALVALQQVRARITELVIEARPDADADDPRLGLAVTGWLGAADAITMEWLSAPTIDRDAVLDLQFRSLHALLSAAGFPRQRRSDGL